MDYKSEKQFILNLWINNPRQATHIIKKKSFELFTHINNVRGSTFSEKCFKFVYNIETPKCTVCNINSPKYLDFNRGYREFCSIKCMSNSEKISQIKQKTIFNKYGVKHFSKTSEYRSKFETTCLQRYGVKNPGQRSDVLTSRSRKKQRTYWNSLCEKIKDKSIPEHSFDQYTHVRDKLLPWKCVKCNITFNSHLFGYLPECPDCYPKPLPGSQSNVETDILSEIRKFYHGEIIENSRKIIAPKELDIFLPNYNLAIEVNGVYWHGNDKVDVNYHRQKYLSCENKGISLLMVTDHDWKVNRELVINMIKHRMYHNFDRCIPAKYTTAANISFSEADLFLKKHHISGGCRGKYYIGLYHNNNLVAVSVFGKNRFSKNGNKTEYELIRFALSGLIAGALGKMISFLKKHTVITAIETYADLRYGNGNVYIRNNFKYVKDTKPGYWYYLDDKIYHRLSWTKKKLVTLGFDPALTETQIMLQRKAIKIYDCGHKLYRIEY